MPMSCDQCQMLSINGVPCHETGCPNEKKEWNGDEWVTMYECIDCGNRYEDADEAYNCCSWEPFETDYSEDAED